jgi:CheY-like chemotaxis protein
MSERALRVLAAEDNPGNRQVLQALFSTLPFSLSLAVNGQEALDAIDREAFDLVLMDANMPVMDGIAALRRIRARADAAAATPVWMLTANVFDEDVARYVAAGADGVLRKPIDLRELLALLSQIAEPSETPAANAA